MSIPPRNPYIAGKALSDSRGFFGREDVFRLVENVLSSPDQNSIVLFGQRRIGKTSILLNLRSRLPSPTFVPVYFDLMDRARKPLADVLYELASTITRALNLKEIPRKLVDDKGEFLYSVFLPSILQRLGENQRLVLLFDEFDVLGANQEAQLPSSAADYAFFPYLRKLMIDYPQLGFVFAVGRKVDELSNDFKMTFKASRYYRVSVLDPEAAESLVRCAEQLELLRFTDEAVEQILTLTACHPYFTQLTCQILFDRKYMNQTVGNLANRVAAEDVETNIPRILEAGENVFQWIWDGLPPVERVVFSAIAEGTDEKTLVSHERIVNILRNQGIRQLLPGLEIAPKTLVEWNMLQEVGSSYKFFVELQRRWVLEIKPLSKVKDELNRVVPRADALYQEAKQFYDSNNLDQAAALLKNVLNTNRYHLKARLLLAEIYQVQGNLDGAVYELGFIYNIDEESSSFQLIRALLARAKLSEEQGDDEKALKDYEWVLTLSPENVTARVRRNAIWYDRGVKALDANEKRVWNKEIDFVDIDIAINAFHEAGALDRVAELEKRKLDIKIGEQAKSADALAQNGLWKEAAVAFKQLLELDPQNPRWANALAKVTREQKISEVYPNLTLWWIGVSAIAGILGGILGALFFVSDNVLLLGLVVGDLAGLVFGTIQWMRFKKDLLIKSFSIIGLSAAFVLLPLVGFFIGGKLNAVLEPLAIPGMIQGVGIVVGLGVGILFLFDNETKFMPSIGWVVLALVLGWLLNGMLGQDLWNAVQGVLLIAILGILAGQIITVAVWRLAKIF